MKKTHKNPTSIPDTLVVIEPELVYIKSLIVDIERNLKDIKVIIDRLEDGKL